MNYITAFCKKKKKKKKKKKNTEFNPTPLNFRQRLLTKMIICCLLSLIISSKVPILLFLPKNVSWH